MDTRTADQVDYDAYLDSLPRAEFRRTMKAQEKYNKYQRSRKVRERDEERRLDRIKRSIEREKQRRHPWSDD